MCSQLEVDRPALLWVLGFGFCVLCFMFCDFASSWVWFSFCFRWRRQFGKSLGIVEDWNRR